MPLSLPYIASPFIILGLISLLALCSRWVSRSDRKKKLPGPKTYPFIGRVHDLPVQHMWLQFDKWAKEYGPIYETKMFNQHFVVISSEKIAGELLNERSAIYSDRPSVPALSDSKSTFGSGEYLPLMGRNEYWVRQRKFAHRVMHDTQSTRFYNYPELEGKRLLVNLLENPDSYSSYLEDFTAKVIARLAWGLHSESDVLKADAWALLTQMSPAGPKNNLLTLLNHIPTFINPWIQNEKKRHERQRQWFLRLEAQVAEQVVQKEAKPSWMRTYLQTKHLHDWSSDTEGAYAVGMMAVAGVFTVGGPLHFYLLAMIEHPKWFKLLQEELDRVCPDSMPTTADSPRLPILRAIIKECLRWKPVVPTGVAHEVEEDDYYRGFFIPKGARILPLETAFCRDEVKYPDANRFRPERWLEPGWPTYKEPLTQHPSIRGHTLFGWGQRTCQGQGLAEAELIVACAGIAWGFDLTKKIDAQGHPISPDLNKSNSLLIIKPDPFELAITPRSERRRTLIMNQWRDAQECDV